jgi:hypothetical protein
LMFAVRLAFLLKLNPTSGPTFSITYAPYLPHHFLPPHPIA